MSGWDAPTGNWDSGEEPEGSRSDDQGSQPTGAHRAGRGDGVLRAGRRSLPGYDQAQGYDQPTRVMRYGQAADQEQAYGTAAADPLGVGPQNPVGSGPQNVAGSGPRNVAGSGPQNVAGSGPQTVQAPQGPVVRRAIGSGSLNSEGYDRGSGGAYPGYGSQDASSPARSGVDDPGYGTQAFGQQDPGPGHDFATQAFGQQDRGTGQDFGTQAFSQQGYGRNDYGQGAQGYQAEGYPQQGYEPSGYTSGGYADQGYGQPGYGQNGYGQDAHGQPGFERPGGPAYGDEDFGALPVQPRAAQPRSGQRSPQRLIGIRMILYLIASVLSVVLIVLLVVHLAKSGSNNTTGAATSPTASTGTATGTGSGFVFTKAAKAGTLALNAAATRDYTAVAEEEAAPLVQALKARGAGRPGKELVAIYDLSPVTSVQSPDFKAVGFVGFDGTFDEAAVIKYMKAHLKSTRMVSPGAHGGKMICGYNTSTGAKTSECVWITPSTLGLVDFFHGQAQVKYPGASRIALEVRNAVEVKAG